MLPAVESCCSVASISVSTYSTTVKGKTGERTSRKTTVNRLAVSMASVVAGRTPNNSPGEQLTTSQVM